MRELLAQYGLDIPDSPDNCSAIERFILNGQSIYPGTPEDRALYLKKNAEHWLSKTVQLRFHSVQTAMKGVVTCLIPLSLQEYNEQRWLGRTNDVPIFKLQIKWDKKATSKAFPREVKIISAC